MNEGAEGLRAIVDDDPIHIEMARALLKATGADHVSSASDGAAARSLLAENGPFDLILLDLNMPNYNGIEFLDHLRKIDFRGEILIFSAAASNVRHGATQLGKAYGLKVVGALEKPITLQKSVQAYLSLR